MRLDFRRQIGSFPLKCRVSIAWKQKKLLYRKENTLNPRYLLRHKAPINYNKDDSGDNSSNDGNSDNGSNYDSDLSTSSVSSSSDDDASSRQTVLSKSKILLPKKDRLPVSFVSNQRDIADLISQVKKDNSTRFTKKPNAPKSTRTRALNIDIDVHPSILRDLKNAHFLNYLTKGKQMLPCFPSLLSSVMLCPKNSLSIFL